jgi:enterochelin esterase-like enzyme
VPELHSGAAKYSQALAEELVPLLDKTYHTVARPEARGVMGVSPGARLSIYAAFRQPGVFGKVAVQSFFMDRMEAEIVELIEKSEIRDMVVFVEWSRHDFPLIDEKPVDARAESRRLASMLEKRGYAVVTREVPHGRGWAAWRLGTDRILETLFPAGLATGSHHPR